MKSGIKAILAILCALVLILGIVYLQARGDASAMVKNVQELTNSLEEKDRELEELSAAAAKSAAEIEALLADAADSKAEIEVLTENAQKQRAEMEALSADTAEKAAQLETLTGTVEEQSAEIGTLQADIAEKDARIEALAAELSALPAGEDLSTVSEGRYANTKRYILKLRENGIHYTFAEGGSKDTITYEVHNSSDAGTDFVYTLRVAFGKDNDAAAFFVWNLIDYDAADTEAVRALCDELNAEWRWLTYYTDARDNSVNGSYDSVLTDSPEAGTILWETTVCIDRVLGRVYDQFLPFAK